MTTESVFVNEMGEWVVGGFELTSQKDQDNVLFTMGSLLPGASRSAPPEVAKDGWQVTQRLPLSVDSWHFGGLIYEVFNGPGASSRMTGGSRGEVPAKLFKVQQMLVNQNPRQRIAIPKLVGSSDAMQAFYTELTALSDQINTLQMAQEYQLNEYIDAIDRVGHLFPAPYLHFKIVPELVKAVEGGKGGVKGLTAIIRMAKDLSPEDFQRLVSPLIVKMFANPNRLIRIELLTALPDYIGSLDKRIVSDKIFPPLATGFNDTEPAIREHSLKSITFIIDKLSDRQINQELLRLLAKSQNDQQPDIRANTTILLGIIAGKFSPSSRPGVLVAAFGRALKDPHVPSRIAALKALAATAEYFGPQDSASKIMGALSPSLLDGNRVVRDLAASTLDIYLNKIRAAARDLDAKQPDEPASGDETALPSMAMSSAGKGGWGFGLGSLLNTQSQPPSTSSTPAPSETARSTPALQPAASSTAAVSAFEDDSFTAPKAASTTNLPGTTAGGGGSSWDNDDDDWGSFGAAPVAKPVAKKAGGGLKLQPKKTAVKASWDDSASWGLGSSGTGASKIEKKTSKLSLEPQHDATDGWGDDGWGADDDVLAPPTTQKNSASGTARKISVEPENGVDDSWGEW